MAHIVAEDDNGIVIRGARMLAAIGPFADELLVFPSTVQRNTPEDKQYSAEVITTLETLRALLRAAEADAAPNKFGVLTRPGPR